MAQSLEACTKAPMVTGSNHDPVIMFSDLTRGSRLDSKYV